MIIIAVMLLGCYQASCGLIPAQVLHPKITDGSSCHISTEPSCVKVPIIQENLDKRMKDAQQIRKQTEKHYGDKAEENQATSSPQIEGAKSAEDIRHEKYAYYRMLKNWAQFLTLIVLMIKARL